MIIPTLFVIAGGSGGHILPALHLAQGWRQKQEHCSIIFFTGNSSIEKKALQNAAVDRIIYQQLNKFSLRRWWQIPYIAMQCLFILLSGIYYAVKYKPNRVITTGGLLAIPLGFAAWLTGRALEIYELNVIPGKAIKALMPFAKTIHIVFPQSKAHCKWGRLNFSHKCQISPYPLRFNPDSQVTNHNSLYTRINSNLQEQGFTTRFTPARKTLLIVGGSQGSVFLNNLIKELIEHDPSFAARIQVIHQTGSFNEMKWDHWYAQHNVPALTFSYDQRIHEYYSAANVIISRAGAGTLFEIAFFKKPCVIIPLIADTTTHQRENAYAMAEQYPHLFQVIEQKSLQDSRLIISILNNLLSQP